MNKVNGLFFCKYKNVLKIKTFLKQDISITLLFYLYFSTDDVWMDKCRCCSSMLTILKSLFLVHILPWPTHTHKHTQIYILYIHACMCVYIAKQMSWSGHLSDFNVFLVRNTQLMMLWQCAVGAYFQCHITIYLINDYRVVITWHSCKYCRLICEEDVHMSWCQGVYNLLREVDISKYSHYDLGNKPKFVPNCTLHLPLL